MLPFGMPGKPHTCVDWQSLWGLSQLTITCMSDGVQHCQGSARVPETRLMRSTVVAQLTLALLPPGPHLFWLCFFAVLGVLVASTIRVATDMGTGIVTGPPARRQAI